MEWDAHIFNINRETLEETVSAFRIGFPYRTDCCDLHQLPNGSFPWHWHAEAELFYMREGSLEYHVPGGVYLFREGEAGFVNANVMHMTRAADDRPMIQEEHLFLPSLVSGEAGSDIDVRYVRPVLQTEGLDIVKFKEPRAVIAPLRRAYEIFTEGAEGWELRVRALLSEAWLQVFSQTRELRGTGASKDPDAERIRRMLSYIAGHFADRVTLGQIAQAGFVGERECFRIFRRCLGMTPMECLMSQRLSHAAALLRTTDQPILDVALSCGFCSGSYFGKVFREQMGVTPREYRTANLHTGGE